MKNLSGLLKRYREISESERNLENLRYFRKTRSIIMEKFRGVPKALEETENKIPFIYWVSLDIWRDLFQIDIARFYTDPLYYLENWLKMRIFYFENFDDCNCFEPCIPICLGEGFEATLFGCKWVYSPDHEPAIDRSYKLIENLEDLKQLKIPDFYDNPQMELAITFYTELSNIARDYGIEIAFNDWHYGPTAVAIFLRGFENLVVDFTLNPSFITDLMNFIVESRTSWSKKRDQFLGIERPDGGLMYNDDVCTPNISPKIYREQILPWEQKIHDFYGNLVYYHNCGPIDAFLHDITTFKNLDFIHSGPFSDYRKVGEHFHEKAPIEIHLRPEQDFITCSEKEFEKRLVSIKENYSELEVQSYCIRVTTYKHPNLTTEQNLSKLKRWCDISNQVLLQKKVII
jgi:hypothetical protein